MASSLSLSSYEIARLVVHGIQEYDQQTREYNIRKAWIEARREPSCWVAPVFGREE